jgi:hypothetical protein
VLFECFIVVCECYGGCYAPRGGANVLNLNLLPKPPSKP